MIQYKLKRGTVKTVASTVCSVVLAGGVALAHGGSAAASKPVTVEIKDAQGQSVGAAVLSEAPHGVKIKLDVKGLPAGGNFLHTPTKAKSEAANFQFARAPPQ